MLSKKLACGMIFAVFLSAITSLIFIVQPVESSGTIYIRADGSIEPSTANITSVDNITYTFTDNNHGEIEVEKSNIIIDGNGSILQGTGSGNGISLSGMNNVTIKNMEIRAFHDGVHLWNSSSNTISANHIMESNDDGVELDYHSHNNRIYANNITNNESGVLIEGSTNNTICGNALINNRGGIGLIDSSCHNSICGNNITYSDDGIMLDDSSNCNSIAGNEITNNDWGIYLSTCSNNTISENSITENEFGVYLSSLSLNNLVSRNKITDNDRGIHLEGYSDNNTIHENNLSNNFMFGIALDHSSHNTISGNSITENTNDGIWLFQSSHNTISENNITRNNEGGIVLDYSSHNIVSGNVIAKTNNGDGFFVESSINNTIVNNTISSIIEAGLYLSGSNESDVHSNVFVNNTYGIGLGQASNNRIYYNDFINNFNQILLEGSDENSWDNGYPSGGNYWNDYNGTDLYRGFHQNETGSDGIGDTPYVIDENNTDYYPLMGLFGPLTIEGGNVTVFPAAKIGLIYETIATQGLTKANMSDVGPSPSSGFRLAEQYYTIETTAIYFGRIQIRIIYDESNMTQGDEESLQLMQWNDSLQKWTDITTHVDIQSNVIFGETNHLSTFAMFTPIWRVSFLGADGYPVVDFAIYKGNLYAAADNNLYTYNGSSWSMIDTSTFVVSLEPYEAKLVVGGQGGLYTFNGTDFTFVFHVPTYIKTLGVYNDMLYAGTILDNPPTLYYCNGSAEYPINWHIDTSFSAILNFSGPFGSIDSFAAYNNRMYVTSGGTVYSFNGTDWGTIEMYDDVCAFLDMQVYDGKLYLATRDQGWRKPIYQGGTGFSGRIIEYDGDNWTEILDHDYWIFSLETYNSKLYAGTANKIFTYNGTDWEISFTSEEGAYYAISLITYDGKIYAGMGNGYIFADPPYKSQESETVAFPEFPSFIFLPFFMLTMLVAVLIKRRKRVP